MTPELTKAAPNNHGPIHETDLYDFAGWLTTRPGVMVVGSSCEAGPMAEAVSEYIKTFPERFALTQRPAAQEVESKTIDWHAVTLSLDEAHDESLDGRHVVARARLREVCANIRASLPAPQQATPTREAREAEQRARMQARQARHEGKATADFDLPAPNDAPQQATPAQEAIRLADRIKSEAKHAAYLAEIDNLDARDAALDKLVLLVDALTAFTAPQQATPEPERITVQEAWEAAGGNPGIKASKADLLEALRQLDKVCDEATPEPVPADSGEHLRVIASLGAALRRLSFAAQTSGGTAGPDAELQAAIGQAEQALSFGGIAQAMFATPEPLGEPVARVELMQTGGNAGLATRIVEIDDPLRERLRPGDVLYTRPAPSVPDAEDLRDRLVAISAAVADSDDRAAQSMLGEILRMLAAAQAKGGV